MGDAAFATEAHGRALGEAGMTWSIDDLDTPAVIVDLDKMEANLRRAQAYADAHGLRLRPHIKTHKIPELAKRQVELGAVGITCQKLGEAEVMADHGLADILLTFNLLGRAKMQRLVTLARRVRLSATLDNVVVAGELDEAMRQAGLVLPVLIECDSGGERCGVQTPEEAVGLARVLGGLPGLRFEGLMTYPAKGRVAEATAWLEQAKEAFGRAGIEPRIISTGGTPDLYRAHEVACATEHRPGTYIYRDRSLVDEPAGFDDCALRVLATVVSRPTDGRAILDAGSKTLSSDTLGLEGFGHVVEYPKLEIAKLSEEHGHVDCRQSNARPRIGERVTIVPNHACVVSNLHDLVHGVRGQRVERVFRIEARGRVQ
jgi:D-serine deaminase-like pyridoxal phosphate-dependent protein